MIRAAADFAYRCGIVALFCAAFAWAISMNEAQAETLVAFHIISTIVWPDGKIVVYCKAPSVYGTKRDCIQDAPDEACTARRVLITEVK